MHNDADGRTITLVGQSRSGKTNLLSALMCTNNALNDLQEGPQPVLHPALSTLADPGSPAEKNYYSLTTHRRNILRGRDYGNEGTDQVRGYPALLQYDEPEPDPQKQRGIFGGKRANAMANRVRLGFTIVDGRGGDIAAADYIEPNNPQNQQTISRQNEYRYGLDNSIGMVICMPIVGDEYSADIADHLVLEINAAIRRKVDLPTLPPLRYVSLVFTKYDSLFAAEGVSAGRIARRPEEAVKQLRGQAMMKKFASIFHQGQATGGYETLIFPASTFGFVEGEGAANYYDYPPAPGLLIRAIDELDYTDTDLNITSKTQLRDHFPLPVSEQEAETCWRPFNIAPPVLFALTGRVTGPLALRPKDLL